MLTSKGVYRTSHLYNTTASLKYSLALAKNANTDPQRLKSIINTKYTWVSCFKLKSETMKPLLPLLSTTFFCVIIGLSLYSQNKYLLDHYTFKIYGGDRENFEILYQGKLDSVSSSGILFNDVNSINLTEISMIRISNEKRPPGIGIITGATGGLLGGIIAGFIGGLDFKPCTSGSFSCLKFTPIDTGLLGGISGALIGGILLQRNRTLNISGSQYRYNKKFYRRKKWFHK